MTFRIIIPCTTFYPTFRRSLLPPFSGWLNLVQAYIEAVRPLKMGPVGFSKTPVNSYQHKQCNNPEERRPHTRDGSLMSRLRFSLRHYRWKFEQSRAGTDVCCLIPVPPTPSLWTVLLTKLKEKLRRNSDTSCVLRLFWTRTASDESYCSLYLDAITLVCWSNGRTYPVGENIVYSERFRASIMVWDLRSSGTLRSVDWQLATDVSVQYTSPIFSGRAENGTHIFCRNFGNYKFTLRNIPEERISVYNAFHVTAVCVPIWREVNLYCTIVYWWFPTTESQDGEQQLEILWIRIMTLRVSYMVEWLLCCWMNLSLNNVSINRRYPKI
jgi:hypothetical protein